MRRFIVLLFLLTASACSRAVYSAPAPSRAPRVVLAGAPNPLLPVAGSDASSVEAVDYLLSRGMDIPVAGATMDGLRDTFDEGRDGGRVHRALDIMAPRGTPVLSADDGRILRVSSNTLGGNIIYASDPQGRVVYYYAHLDAYHSSVIPGATIARGDTLGYVGTTGNAPRDVPHLHFQVMRMPPDGRYWDGDPINPYPLMLLTRETARP